MTHAEPVVLKKWYHAGKNFFVPRKQNINLVTLPEGFFGVAVIPTLNPTPAIYELITSLLANTIQMHVVVVDDGGSFSGQSGKILQHIKELGENCDRAHYIRLPQNRRKPGAINAGIDFIAQHYANRLPEIIITCDDDVRINEHTVELLVQGLFSSSTIGAASTTARVSNKNHNILTRLQALEYHGFSISKVADNGFYHGPLVMQGMFTAFRYHAIKEVKGFSEANLIEDYDITARMKKWGWNVLIVPHASAWTDVPTKLSQLWRQRVRWTYWGLHVVRSEGNYFAAVLQDIIGHVLFLSTIALIAASFVLDASGSASEISIRIIVLLALSQFVIGTLFHIFVLKRYADADLGDWILRLTLIPETVYSMILSIVMLGSYVFFLYTTVIPPVMTNVYKKGLKTFGLMGYTASWGTRTSNS